MPKELGSVRGGEQLGKRVCGMYAQVDPQDANRGGKKGDVDALRNNGQGNLRADDGADQGGTVSYVIPWPPSGNTIWRSIVIGGRVRVLLSKEGREYRQRVQRSIGPCKPMSGRVFVAIKAYPPDRRKRDADNVLKAALDAMTHAGVWDDDSQARSISIDMLDAGEKPRLEVLIGSIE